MQDLERVYMRTLRYVYDTELQLTRLLPSLSGFALAESLIGTLARIEEQSVSQVERLERIFTLLYLEPLTEPSWVATALLREAHDCCSRRREGGTQGCAAALLAVKRYEITLYEALLRWSEQCHLVEALPDIRRSIAEELLQASLLSELAFEDVPEQHALITPEASAVH